MMPHTHRHLTQIQCYIAYILYKEYTSVPIRVLRIVTISVMLLFIVYY